MMQQEYLSYYANFNEESRLTSNNYARIEFDTTISQLEPYIAQDKRAQSKTLTELGAATGRYSLYYADKGLAVTSVELVPELVEQLKEKATRQGKSINIYMANATDISFIEDNSQDVVLALGPFYHLQSLQQRQSAIAEAYRVLKPNGVFAVAYISRFFVAGLLAKISPSLVTDKNLTELKESGLVTTKDVDPFFRTGYFATPNEMEDLLISGGFTAEKHISTDGFCRFIGSEVNSLTEEQYQAWLAYHLSVCDEPSLLGFSNHGLVITRKSAICSS